MLVMVVMAATLCRHFLQKISIVSRVKSFAASTSKIAGNQDAQERKVNVNGVDINYLKAGTGEHVVLFLPGVAGAIWPHFKPQIEGLDREKFTMVVWEPVGYGKSRPPDRTFPDDFFHRDATHARNLMKVLGFTKFSMVGWSDGGITALILAATFPENVRKMVSYGVNAYITPTEIEIYKSSRDFDSWSEKRRAPMIAVYGEDYSRKMWADWVDACVRIYEKQNGNLCKELLPKIRCPTFLLHGAKDRTVLAEHPIYLKQHIHGAKLKIIEDGRHSIHLQYPKEFNDLITEFLLE
ncbi:serine hydrolase BPHL [Augochlora pura]